MLPLLLLSLLLSQSPKEINKTLEKNMGNKIEPTLRSKAEETNFEETSRYDDVMKFITSLQKKSNVVRLVTFGQTEEGRDLPLLILSDPPVMQPLEARQSGKPLIFIMANIHAGEVEGKEAMLQLSRRLVTGDLRPLLRKLVILIAPIYNADGNERIDPKMRTAQHGPINGVGTRENARGLDLNRDYMNLNRLRRARWLG